jgi:hypothetical protein
MERCPGYACANRNSPAGTAENPPGFPAGLRPSGHVFPAKSGRTIPLVSVLVAIELVCARHGNAHGREYVQDPYAVTVCGQHFIETLIAVR